MKIWMHCRVSSFHGLTGRRNFAASCSSESHDKFRTINPQFSFLSQLPPQTKLMRVEKMCGMTLAIVHSKIYFRIHPVAEKKSTKQFLLICFPVEKKISSHDPKKVCFGFRLIQCGLRWRWETTNDERKPWKICGVILEPSQFIVREWFSRFSFEQTNTKICFYIFTSMKMISVFFFWEKVRARFHTKFSVSPSWMKRAISLLSILGDAM